MSATAAPADFWETLPLHAGVRLIAKDANGLAAFDKPAVVLSHPNGSEDEARALLTCRYDKDAQCFHWKTADGAPRWLWLLNRLDSATSGVILTAASEKLALAVREHFAKKQVHKIYNALVFGRPQKPPPGRRSPLVKSVTILYTIPPLCPRSPSTAGRSKPSRAR